MTSSSHDITRRDVIQPREGAALYQYNALYTIPHFILRTQTLKMEALLNELKTAKQLTEKQNRVWRSISRLAANIVRKRERDLQTIGETLNCIETNRFHHREELSRMREHFQDQRIVRERQRDARERTVNRQREQVEQTQQEEEHWRIITTANIEYTEQPPVPEQEWSCGDQTCQFCYPTPDCQCELCIKPDQST